MVGLVPPLTERVTAGAVVPANAVCVTGMITATTAVSVN
jgi:hypothetical protein